MLRRARELLPVTFAIISHSGAGCQAFPACGVPGLVVLASKQSILPNIEFTNAGCVLESVMLAATELGLDSIYLWMTMYGINDEPELMERLGFPEGFTCVGTVALGYAEKEFKKPKADEMRIEAVII